MPRDRGAALAAWAKRARAVSGGMADEPSDYFTIDAKTQMIPMTKLRTTRARPEGIANAEVFMQQAARGEKPKRKPISARKEPDGSYSVLDGNSTTAVARKHGWKSLPAHVEE